MTTIKKTIAIDADGVLTNTIQVFLKLYHEKYPDNPIPPITDMGWELWEYLGISKEEVFELFAQMRDGNHYKYAAPVDANFYVWLKMIIADGHECYILTANPESFKELLEYWLAQYGLTLPIVFVKSIKDKKDHHFDILIDDSPSAYEMMDWGVGQDRSLILYNHTYNSSVPSGRANLRVYRVYNWRDVFDNINFLSGDW